MVHIKTAILNRLKRAKPAQLIIIAGVAVIGMWSLAAIFADTTDYAAPTNLKATATNNASYGLAVSWSPGAKQSGAQNTADGWIVVVKNGATVLTNDYINTYSTHSDTINGLQCSITYTIEVRAERKSATSDTGHAGESPYSTTTGKPACPTASITGFSASGSTLNLSWSTSFGVGFTVYLGPANGTATTTNEGNVRSASFGGACGTRYLVSMTASAGGQTGPGSASTSATTAACPVTPPSGGGGGGGGSGGGGSTGGGSTGGGSGGGGSKSSGSGGGGSASNVTVSAPQPPGAPTNFAATVQSSKVVELSWGPSVASAGISNYNLQRSTDNVNWGDLGTPASDDTSYEDDTADFSMTYYYRLQAVDNSGNVSAYSTTQATTTAFAGTSSNTVTSDDKLVKLTIPDGAFDQATDCSISQADTASASGGNGQSILAGPYSLLCVGEDGTIVTDFKKPLAFSVNLSQIGTGFSNFTIRTIDGSKLTTVKSTYNPKTQQLTFSLTSAKSFAVYGTQHKSAGGTIIAIIVGLLLLAAIAFGVVFLKRRMAAGGPSAVVTAEMAQQPVAGQAPPQCSHLNMAHQVQPRTDGCEECIAVGRQWKALRICLTCGHVGCSDDSEGQDARKHYEQTGHPLIMVYGDPAAANLGWCYADQLYI